MLNKRFSLVDAYEFGFKTTLTHFGFFFVTMIFGALLSLLFLSSLGVIDFMMFPGYFETLVKMFSSATHEAFGGLNVGMTTVSDHVRAHAPEVMAKHIAPSEMLSLDVSGQSFDYIFKFLLPAGLVFKLFADMISIGWTKIALDIKDKKNVSYSYIYKFYYLTPRVFIAGIITSAATLFSLIFFIIPGVYVYQRLRFARYYIIDKDQSIIQALESSWNVSDGSVIHLTGYSLLTMIIAGLGNMLFLVQFFLMPMAYQVDAHVYRQLQK